MIRKSRQAFTIIELLMVIGIISVLVTIVTTAATNAIRSSRSQRRSAMQIALQTAITTYQAADSQGKWPGALQAAADGGVSRVLSTSEAQDVFRIIVQRATGESGQALPLIDPRGLFVAPTGAEDGKTRGLSFDDARRRGGASRKGGSGGSRKLRVSEMEFGFPGLYSGKFYHFNLVYHAQSDSVTVSMCCEKCLSVDGCNCNNKCPHCHYRE